MQGLGHVGRGGAVCGSGLYSGKKKFPGKNGNIKKTSVFFSLGPSAKTDAARFPGKNGVKKRAPFYYYKNFSKEK